MAASSADWMKRRTELARVESAATQLRGFNSFLDVLVVVIETKTNLLVQQLIGTVQNWY